jgi:uncharacterized membrane protein
MRVKTITITIIFIAVAMLLLDTCYLYLNRPMFMRVFRAVQHDDMRVKTVGVVLCYFLLILGLYYFIISRRRPVMDAFLFGLVIYGVYETTNYATFNKWTLLMLLLDTVWGGTLFALTTWITYLLLKL